MSHQLRAIQALTEPLSVCSLGGSSTRKFVSSGKATVRKQTRVPTACGGIGGISQAESRELRKTKRRVLELESAVMESFWSSLQDRLLATSAGLPLSNSPTACSTTRRSFTTAAIDTQNFAVFHSSDTSAGLTTRLPDSTRKVGTERVAGRLVKLTDRSTYRTMPSSLRPCPSVTI